MRTTDDTGTFRLFGLSPGSYYVMVRPEDVGRFGNMTMAQDVSGFAPTYYPGTPDASEAQPIDVTAGAEVAADVSLIVARLTTVSGIVVNAIGQPASGGHVSATPTLNASMPWGPGTGAQIESNGTFSLMAVPPGSYVIQARPYFGVPDVTPMRANRLASATVTVSGGPVTGVRIVMRDPVKIPVSTIFEDGDAPNPERVYVSAQADGTYGAAERDKDGHMTLEIAPGSYRLSASAEMPWRVKRLSYRGRDFEANDEVELGSGPEGRIEIVFTTRSAIATGAVTDTSGKSLTDFVVLLFPADAELARRTGFSRMRTARADQRGQFRFDRLPPGAYLAAAVTDVEREDMWDPDFLEQLRPSATDVTLREGETATLALKLTALP
jgi:hypothetical protein